MFKGTYHDYWVFKGSKSKELTLKYKLVTMCGLLFALRFQSVR